MNNLFFIILLLFFISCASEKETVNDLKDFSDINKTELANNNNETDIIEEINDMMENDKTVETEEIIENEVMEIVADGNDISQDTVESSERLAKVFINDPITDNYETKVVKVLHLTSPDGELKGKYANVYNCLNKEGGQVMMAPGGNIQLCKIEKTVKPDNDGNYFSVSPPLNYTDSDDSFAELMMYEHLNQIHDFYKQKFGFSNLDFSMPAIVNIEMKQGNWWQPFDNAAFMPPTSLKQMGFELDINTDHGAVIFGQGSYTDFCYDSSVIYHEYTHAVVSENRLSSNTFDIFGFNNQPMAINEGTADYFSSAARENPVVGTYALNFAGMFLGRDISEFKKCPDDLIGESHEDGKIYSSTIWDIRNSIDKKIADEIIFESLMQFKANTDFHEAATILLETANQKGAEIRDKVNEVIEKHNILNCERIKEFENIDYVPYDRPWLIDGLMTSGLTQFSSFVPQTFQFKLDISEKFDLVTLTFGAKISDQYAYYYQGKISVAIAIRVNSPIIYKYSPKATITADYFEEVKPDNNGKYKIIISGSCIDKGKVLYIQFLNKTLMPIQITYMKSQFSNNDGLVSPDFICE